MKNILFIANSDRNWMGGVYYVRNIVYQFLMYPLTVNTFRVFIYLDKSVAAEFDFCKKYENVKLIYRKNSIFEKKDNKFSRNYAKLKLINVVYKEKIDYIYPYFTHDALLSRKAISWIPDFQHYWLKDFFSNEEYEIRERYYLDIAHNHYKLILSSKDSYNTYKKLYPNDLKNVFVVPFISALDEKSVMEERTKEIFDKYTISDSNYFLVSNQFWQHKNHTVVIEALKIVRNKGYDKIKVVCTGLTEDYRNKQYFDDLLGKIELNGIGDNIKILGLIPRIDQLHLMKNAIAVIQPSLFEGWGTVVEDAKTLGKITVMSDIEVHKEQKDEKSLLFKKNSPSELAEILIELWDEYSGKEKIYKFGINKVEEYGKNFYDAVVF